MEMKKNHVFFLLLILLLFAPCILSKNQEPPVQLGEKQLAYRGMRMMVEHFGKMDIQVNDYPVPGPNNRHQPKSPGTA